MINPGGIPRIPGDMGVLARHAQELGRVGPEFSGTGQQVNSTWQQLAGVYEAPEVGQLLAATGPVQATAASVGEDIATVGTALSTYAATVKQIQEQLDALRTQAQNLVAEAKADKDSEGAVEKVGEFVGIGGDDDEYAERSNALIGQVNAQVAAFAEAQRVCANAINALYGGIQYRADDGDADQEAGEYGFTAEQLNSAFEQGQQLPWGSYAETDTGIVGGAWDGMKNFASDLGALIGRDPVTGDWSWSTAGTAWKGLGTFVLAVGVYAIPGGSVLDQKFNNGALTNTLVNAGKGLIAYDEWGKGDNARAGGMAGFNILSSIVGTKGAGGALRTVGAGAKTSRIGAVSRAGAAMVRGGEFIGRLPTTESLITRVSQHLPHLRLPGGIPDVNVPHHIDTPRVETPRVETPNPGSVGDNLADPPAADPTPDTHQGTGPEGTPHGGPDPGDGPDGDAPTEHRASTDHMPPPEPGNQSLETLAESRVERGPDGLIETVDGRPVHESLRDIAEQRAEQYREARANGEFTGQDIGKVSSVAIDRQTGEIVEATNGRRGDVIDPERVHPLLEERLRELRRSGPYPDMNTDGSINFDEQGNPATRHYPHFGEPLQHAEVKAVNELLWRRGPDVASSVFEQLRVDNYFPLGKDGVRPAPCCVNCSQLLSGTPSNAGRFSGFPPGPHNLLPE